ncbi:MAG: fibronectin type III domain-containing protein [Bacteroidia bacterium]
MTRVHVVLHLTLVSASQLAIFAAHILTSMTGNTHFTTPYPTLAMLQTAITNLNTTLAAQVKGNKASTQAVKTAVYQVKRVLRAMAANVEYISNDDATTALTSGFSLSQTGTHATPPFVINHNGNLGQINAKAKATKLSSYIWQYTTTPLVAASWVTSATTMQATHVFVGLNPGTMYWFRVAVVDKNGQQPFSNAINLIAL